MDDERHSALAADVVTRAAERVRVALQAEGLGRPPPHGTHEGPSATNRSGAELSVGGGPSSATVGSGR
jgi:hypothetical protein